MKPKTGRVDILLLGGAALMQAAGFLVLQDFGILHLISFWHWCFIFL
jgi:hypothetical protein